MQFLTDVVKFLTPVFQYRMGANTLGDFITAATLFIIGVIVLKIFKFSIINKLNKSAEATSTQLDDLAVRIIQSVHWPFYVMLSLYIAAQFLILAPAITKSLNYLIIILLAYYGIRAGTILIEFATNKISEQKGGQTHQAAVLTVMGKIAKASLWMIAGLMILSNLGYNISTLIAGVGIGGIAVALALQNILSDLFCSMAIYFDKPFEVGDFVNLGEHMGVVKQIGLRSTRLLSLSGEELVVSNRELTSTRIRNFKKMQKRRILFGFGVIYGTSSAKLRKIPEIVAEIFKKYQLAELDRVHFKEFGAFSLNFEVVYFVKNSTYNVYMDIQQAVNFDIKDAFEKEGVEMAFPTQTLYLNKQS